MEPAGDSTIGTNLRNRLGGPLLGACLALVGLLAALPAGAAAANPTFATPTATAGIATSQIWGIASGDLNGDGRADVVTANHNPPQCCSSWIGVQLANPDGSLAEPVPYVLPRNNATSATLGDFDDDGDLDVVGVSEAGATVFANDGAGVLTEGVTLGSGFGTSGSAAGDFDRDGNLDLAVVFGSEAKVFLGTGDNSFEEGTAIGFDDESWGLQLVVADFEGDGSADLAATLYDNSSTEVLTSNDDGTFTSRGTYRASCCGRPEGLAAADLDADGRDDLVVAERNGNRIFSIIAGPSATFTTGPSLDIPDGPWEAQPIWVAAGDLNGDGFPDVATADYMNDAMTVFVGDGEGGFAISETLLPTYPGIDYFAPHANAIDDFDGDGRLDLVVASQEPPVLVYLNAGEPAATIAPTNLDFDPWPVGFPSAPLIVHVENDGNVALAVSGATLLGAEADEFALDASDCLDGPVLAGVGCDVEVVFSPLETGGATAMLAIESDNPDGDLEVPLSGLGITPEPNITLDPASLDFDTQKVGTTSAPLTIAIGNDGFADLQVEDIGLAGDAADFGWEDGCETRIEPGEECELEVSFAPVSAGAKAAELVVFSDAPGDPAAVPLAGAGTLPEIVADPAALGFADQAAGSASEFAPIEIENAGAAALELGAIGKSGADRFDFAVYSAECAQSTLAPGASCTIWASFRPSLPGARSATVLVESDDPEGPLSVPLDGTATGPGQRDDLFVSPGLIGYGERVLGSASPPSTVTIANFGAAPLVLASATIGGGAASDYALSERCPGELARGESCELAVTFTPGQLGARGATLTVAADTPGGTATVALSGTGIAAPAPTSQQATPRTTPPRARFTRKPGARIGIASRVLKRLKVAFASDHAGAGFECSLDGRRFATCRSPLTLKRLKLGRHTLRVRAVAGDMVGKAVAARFRVVRHAQAATNVVVSRP